MRIHIQTPADDTEFGFTPAQFATAAAAAGEPPYSLSFGHTPEDFAAVADQVELLIGSTPLLKPLRFGALAAATSLRLIFVNAAGVDGLSPFDWLPNGVTLLNNRGTHANKAGDFIVMAALMLSTGMPGMLAAQRDARWQPAFSPPLATRRVTILGTGDLGSAGARALGKLGVQVTGVRRSAAPHPDFAAVHDTAALDALLPETGILVLACPLTPDSAGVLSRARIALLPQGAGVVNIGRGRLADQDALCDALESGHLGGAVLDVFDPEPLPAEHRIWRTRNLIATPHISCDDPASYNPRSLAILFANLRAWRAGAALPNRVDTARGY